MSDNTFTCNECNRGGPHHEWSCSKVSPARVRVKFGVLGAGQEGTRLGPDVYAHNQHWTPVLWDDEEDPDFFKTRCLDFKTPNMSFEFELDEDGSVNVDVNTTRGLVSLTWAQGFRSRITRFPMRMVGQLVAILLRECGVSTYRYSARNRRHRISMQRGRCVSDVGGI